eukprot:51543-Rhodomonas_salina.1
MILGSSSGQKRFRECSESTCTVGFLLYGSITENPPLCVHAENDACISTMLGIVSTGTGTTLSTTAPAAWNP